jgi:two-component system OmpR family response regulator
MSTDAGERAQPTAKLLVVEDEPNILELLAASLRYAGFEVVTAAAGSDAVQAAQRHRPDLIVLDVMLPDMDGFDVLHRLRGGGTRIPVVFLTARDSTEDKIRGLTLGGDDYVTKPFSLEEVIARIHAGRIFGNDRPRFGPFASPSERGVRARFLIAQFDRAL